MSALPTTVLARLPKHVARLNSCIARLHAAGHSVVVALTSDRAVGRPARVGVLVDGATPEVAAAQAVLAADVACRSPSEEPRSAPKAPATRLSIPGRFPPTANGLDSRPLPNGHDPDDAEDEDRLI